VLKTVIYCRLSKEDAESLCGKDNSQSESIKNQRELLADFVNKSDELELICVLEDDGSAGYDFDRPKFQIFGEMCNW
jgi:DNA invertase Pin-like site-specific DNA recombinase